MQCVRRALSLPRILGVQASNSGFSRLRGALSHNVASTLARGTAFSPSLAQTFPRRYLSFAAQPPRPLQISSQMPPKNVRGLRLFSTRPPPSSAFSFVVLTFDCVRSLQKKIGNAMHCDAQRNIRGRLFYKRRPRMVRCLVAAMKSIDNCLPGVSPRNKNLYIACSKVSEFRKGLVGVELWGKSLGTPVANETFACSTAVPFTF